MQKLTLEIRGKMLEGYVQSMAENLWVHVQGQTILIEGSKPKRNKRGLEGKSSPHQIVAPMPGKITKVCVEPAGSVSPGFAVVVMEAMKMEYTLKSEIESTVDEILIQVGDQVQLGQVLVRLKEIPS